MTHLFDLTGKKAVVTGGGTGIGLAMAKALADAGATVTLWGRRQEKLDEAVAANEDAGFLTQSVDVAEPQAVADGFAQANERMGGLDIVVVNAGISAGTMKLADVTPEEFRKVLAVNLDGAFFTIQQAAKIMTEQGNGGSIITISSLASIDATPRNYAYGASKSGVVSLTKAAAVELARNGIRVNAVLPGWIRTDMTEGAQASEAFEKAVIPRVPMRRWGNPEDFGGIAVYLGSDASAYQTGTTTLIDGGYAIF